MMPALELHDINPPETVGWWPLAWGWWVLIGLLVAGLLFLLVAKWRRYQHLAAKRAALKELSANATTLTFEQANALLKRVCLAYFDASQIAPLYQQQWCDFLASRLPAQYQSEFSQQWLALTVQQYSGKSNDNERATVMRLCELWLRRAKLAKRSQGDV